MAGLLEQMREAELAQQRGLLSHSGPPKGVTGRELADVAQSMGLLTAPIPGLGDVVGLGADAMMYATQPEQRTWTNYGLTALGVLPFFPALASSLGRSGRVLDVTDADTFKAVKRAMGGKVPEGEIRQAIAQYNAALPPQAGGLGLRDANTAAERSSTLGFPKENLYHGTTNDFPEFGASDRRNVYATDQPRIADIYANAQGRHRGLREVNAGPNVIPLVQRGPMLTVSDVRDGSAGWLTDNLADALQVAPERNLFRKVGERGYSGVKVENMSDLGGTQSQYVFSDPSVLRSRFAAFDPAQRDSRNLLASYAGLGLLSPLLLSQMRGEEQK